MPCFIVTHKPTESYTQEEGIAAAKKLMASLPKDVKWQMSWLIPEEAVMLCHGDAPHSDAIRAALDQSGTSQLLPIVQMRGAFELDPHWYAPRRRATHERVRSRAKAKR